MIKEVILRRFKRFEKETFDLSGHVILAGPNNCGKTTVLQAVAAWALALKQWKSLNDFQRHGGAYTKAPLARQAFSAVPVRTFDLLWKDRAYLGSVEIQVKMEDGVTLAMEFLKDSTEQIYVRPKNSIDPEQVAQLTPNVVYLSTVSGLSVEEPVYQAEYIETLLGRQRPGDVIRNLLYQASVTPAWGELTAVIQRLFGVELLVPQTPGGQIICEYRLNETAPRLDILSAGSGFQQVVVLLASLFTRSGSVVLVDEPDAHLHVFLQDTIFAELRKAAASTKSQLVVATHSEVIFNSTSPEQICVMMGRPRRLTAPKDVQKLQQAVAVLQQSDIVAATSTPGILYLEGYTDLNLLRVWASKLAHPLSDYLNRTPFWRGKQSPQRIGASEVRVNDHYDALRLANESITGIWLIDGDGKGSIPPSPNPEPGRLNRIVWSRYESESYLIHPEVLARYIEKQITWNATGIVREFFVGIFGEDLIKSFFKNPFSPPPLIENYFKTTKARTEIIESLLETAGIHGFDYTRFDEIAALMKPEEIHPEVKEKLDFIQQAFGL